MSLPRRSRCHYLHPVPTRLLLQQKCKLSHPLRLWFQVPCEVSRPDRMPVALLLPWNAEHGPDALPDRTQVRPAGHVRGYQVPAGDVRDVPRQEVLRPVPQGPLLRHADVVCAVPGWCLLSEGIVCAHAMP